MMRSIKNIFLYSLFIFSYLYSAQVEEQDVSSCLKASKNYKFLIKDPLKKPFTMSVGTSMSQTHVTNNTVSPKFVRKKLYEIAQRQGKEKAKAWLKAKNRYWYLLRSMPLYGCWNGHKIEPGAMQDDQIVNKMLDDIVDHLEDSDLIITQCPICDTDRIGIASEASDLFDQDMENKLVNLVKDLDVNLQMLNGLPNVRLSIEISDILQTGTTEIDENKLHRLVTFINKMGNPMLFFHHYANPDAIANLFEEESHISWFAEICAKIIEKLPHISHVCPVSQPTGFAFRVIREDLPPFEYNKKLNVILPNIIKACALASDKMKEVRAQTGGSHLHVLVSHQWKIMKAVHTSILDPRYALETLVASIADSMYNGVFVKYVTPYIDKFDGIALSVYPALRFNMWKPEGSNVAGAVDYEGSIEAVMAIHKAFPEKDIYIVEAGCNTADQQIKIKYIDMMTCVCKKACEAKIPLKGLYFWGITNHPEFYMEWNSQKGSTNFGPYDSMEASSINAAGKYIQEILRQNLLSYDEHGNVIPGKTLFEEFLFEPEQKSHKKLNMKTK